MEIKHGRVGFLNVFSLSLLPSGVKVPKYFQYIYSPHPPRHRVGSFAFTLLCTALRKMPLRLGRARALHPRPTVSDEGDGFSPAYCKWSAFTCVAPAVFKDTYSWCLFIA